MPESLRQLPEGERRPEPLDPAVLNRAVNARHEEITKWLAPRVPTLTPEAVTFAVTAAIKRGGADGFRASMFLKTEFEWPVDMELCGWVRDCCNAMAFALRAVTREWVVRVGIRFPGKDGEKIEWVNEGSHEHAGVIISVDPSYAAAIVQRYISGSPMHQPVRVFAEDVYANINRGEYGSPLPSMLPALTR
jgi:hypothetical protein